MKKLGHYLKLMGVFAKYSLMSALEYRINFVTGMMVEMGWMVIKLLYVAIIYKAGTNIGILTPDHILLFIGTYVLMTGIYMLYFGNLSSIPGMVQQGELDLDIVKPVSLQFLVTMRRVEFAYLLPNLVAGTLMITAGWRLAGLPVGVVPVAGFVFFFVCGCLLTYSLFLLPYLLSFWTVSIGGIADISNALWDFNNMPSMIYGKWMRRIGTYVLPVFVITNFPGLFLMGELSPGACLWGAGAPVLFFLISRKIWRLSLKRYSSASS
ncbi:MAG: ABC-2 family transporter protein [Lachnospiraceae bacterium]|nr:ABC-2 family transporter protein [Lachnospiraceae bacterium]